MLKKIILAIFLSYSVFCFTQVSFNELKGTWQFSSYGETIDLVFQSKDQLIFDGETSSYTLVGNSIRIDDGYYVLDYPFSLDGNSLTISFPEGYELTFSRSSNSNMVIKEQNEKQQVYNKTQQQIGGQENLLQGKLCSWSGSSTSTSSYSNSNWIYFDGQNRFSYGSESSFSSDAGDLYNGSNAENGGTYKVNGDNVTLIFDDGSCGIAKVSFRQDNDEITELEFNGDHYATGLCD